MIEFCYYYKLIRDTIDWDSKSIKLYLNKNTNIINQYNDVILKLKYDLDLDDYVRSNSNIFLFRFSKNSKFINFATVILNTYPNSDFITRFHLSL